MVRIIPCNATLIGFAEFQTVLVSVIKILRTSHDLVEIFPALHILTVKAAMCVLAILEVIPGTVLQILSLKLLEIVTFLNVSPACLVFLILLMRTQINGGQFFLIFFFAELYVLETELLFPESGAEEAVLAPDAVAEKCRGIAVDAILASRESITTMHVDAVVTEFAA